jgi:hypothetical protein
MRLKIQEKQVWKTSPQFAEKNRPPMEDGLNIVAGGCVS